MAQSSPHNRVSGAKCVKVNIRATRDDFGRPLLQGISAHGVCNAPPRWTRCPPSSPDSTISLRNTRVSGMAIESGQQSQRALERPGSRPRGVRWENAREGGWLGPVSAEADWCRGQRSEPDTGRLNASAASLPSLVRKSGNDPGEARCGGCGHRRRDHGQRTCLVCFACSAFTPSVPAQSTWADRAKCACNHRRDRHAGGKGSCGAVACPCRRYRPQIPEGTRDDRASVREIPAGGFESNRRRH